MPERTPVLIRPATRDDALCLSALATQVFLDTYATEGIRPAIAAEVQRSFTLERMEELLGAPKTHVLIAEQEHHLIGFAQVTLDTPHVLVSADRQAELERLYVQEPFTGRGIGTALLEQIEHLSTERKVTTLWLTLWVHNRRAIAFYARRGYRDLGSQTFNLENERHENRVVARELPEGRSS